MYLPLLVVLATLLVATAKSLSVTLETRRPLDSRLANIHVAYSHSSPSEVLFTYGSCSSLSPLAAHHQVARSTDLHHDRLVWRIPENAPVEGCLSAWNAEGELVGRSEPQHLRLRRRRVKRAYSVPMDNS